MPGSPTEGNEMAHLIQTDGTEVTRQTEPYPDLSYRDLLLALADRWKQYPETTLPYASGQKAGAVAKWIRRLAAKEAAGDPVKVASEITRLRALPQQESVRLQQERARLQQERVQLAPQLAKSEQQVREISLDRDRWRRRANEAEALVKSAGVSREFAQ
jgi:hypothetical protein